MPLGLSRKVGHSLLCQVGVRSVQAERYDRDFALNDVRLLEARRPNCQIGVAAGQVQVTDVRHELQLQLRVQHDERAQQRT